MTHCTSACEWMWAHARLCACAFLCGQGQASMYDHPSAHMKLLLLCSTLQGPDIIEQLICWRIRMPQCLRFRHAERYMGVLHAGLKVVHQACL